MNRELKTAVRMLVVTLVLTGILYPLVVTGIARVFLPRQAAGSLVVVDGRVVGSELVGQRFTKPEYFHGRPSAAGADGYDASLSSGANLGPTSKKLHDRVEAEVARLQAENPQAVHPVPVELVTASGSGLDPHLSPAGALWQAPRVAAARGVSVTDIEALVQKHVEPRTWRLFGEPRVNVLRLNVDLDRRFGKTAISGR